MLLRGLQEQSLHLLCHNTGVLFTILYFCNMILIARNAEIFLYHFTRVISVCGDKRCRVLSHFSIVRFTVCAQANSHVKMLSSTERIHLVLAGFTVSFHIVQKAGKAALAGKLQELIGHTLSSVNSIQLRIACFEQADEFLSGESP